MAKVCVTGGAGFIGSNLAHELAGLGHELIAYDDLSTGLKSNVDSSKCKLIEGSITDMALLEKSLASIEYIFHLGARGSVPRSITNPRATHDVNTTGTLNVLEVARNIGAHVVFSSSSSVYGRNGALPKDESMWLGPMTPYAASKLSAESYVQAYGSSYGVPTTLLRFFNVFGPRQRPDHIYAAVLPKWIWKAMKGEVIEVYGDGSQTRDFTYVKTVTDICTDVMNRKVTHDGAINLAYGNQISLIEVIELLKEEFPDLRVEFLGERKGDVKNSQNSPELLKELFPSVKPTEFKEALKRTIAWLADNGDSVANGPSVSD